MEEEEDGGVRLLRISDLLRRSRPLAGASSLNHRCPISRSSEPQPSDRSRQPCGPAPPRPSQNPGHRILESLNYPTVIIGTLTLPFLHKPSILDPSVRCPKSTCFSFSDYDDASSNLCCDVVDFDVRIIGRKIRVLAWNFIPFECGGGFLEIISWRLTETSSTPDAFPLVLGSSADCKRDSFKARFVLGVLESISPVSVVPCATGVSSSTGSRNICGFLVQLLVCECKLCSTKASVIAFLERSEVEDDHCFTKPLIVYFYGSASSWHPAMSKLIGNIIVLSGLKKKLVFLEEEESLLMYLTTEKTFLHLPKLLSKWLPVNNMNAIKGKGECGTYAGTITGIYMQGMVVELDQKVLLLLTDQHLSPPHSLRVGAVVLIRNVHFVNPKFSWAKTFVLGACVKTSINLRSFSPFETGSCTYSRSQSLLRKFIDSLMFSIRLWVLLLVSSFRRKFAGILSEKEILGSKHKEGLAQSYATSCIPSSLFQSRHGVFREFCKHDSCGCGNEQHYVHLKLVVPISNFINHCEATWMKMLLEWESDSNLMYNYDMYGHPSCEGFPYSQPIRRILRSEDMGVVLLGCIKVHNFTLVMEGMREHLAGSELSQNESLSCRAIFANSPVMREGKLALYLLYNFRDRYSRNCTFHPCIKNNGNFKELQSGRFHLLLVTHKYPVQQKFQGEQFVSNSASMFAEAFILPWDLLLDGKDGYTNSTSLSEDLLNESMEHYGSRNLQEFVYCKRYKIDQTSTMVSKSGLSNAEYEFCGSGHCCFSNTCATSCQMQKCTRLNLPPEIQCYVTFRSINNQLLSSSGLLCPSKAKVKVSSVCKPRQGKVLLEFKCGGFGVHELLSVGRHYSIKHHKEDKLCTTEDFSYGKVTITSKIHLWSLSFSSDEVLPDAFLSHLPRCVDPIFSTDESLPESSLQSETSLLRCNVGFPEIHSDICVRVSIDHASIFEENLKFLDGFVVQPSVPFEEVTDLFLRYRAIVTGSVQYSASLKPEYPLPEGNLISLHGDVLAVHNSSCSSIATNLRQKSPADAHLEKFLQGTETVCIHVLVDHQIVRIFGALTKHAYPIGFGPGIKATFHRILVLSGQSELILTPTSFIAIQSVRVVNDQYSIKYDNPSAASGLCKFGSLTPLPSTLISQITRYADCKPVQFNCRVVSIYILVLEQNIKAVYPHSGFQSRSPMVNIPLAGFVLDDGSSLCCSWASNDRAATLLRLEDGIPGGSSLWDLKRKRKRRIDDTCGSPTLIHKLEKILNKHGRVIVKNYGSLFDSSGQQHSFSVDSETLLSSSDEDLVKAVIFNAACFGTFWNVIGSLMDSTAMKELEKQLVGMEMMPIQPPMQNIWAKEVHYSNPLLEARKILQQEELVNS
ncbi:CST complex subunit CTC1 isoform X2 [Diospyros lotus]|uniref:CST complex subunit CTC1 isoform X2 n=1 Tax=Diospyros lotus TaxID=55363 RepID=UPI002259BDEB|nr:CST complex subunit CTC1 isoform X2 [Diospyros lotus]